MLEVKLKLGSSLDTSVPYLTDLDGVEAVPLASVELFVEIDDEFAVYEVEAGFYHCTHLLVFLFTLRRLPELSIETRLVAALCC